MDPASVACRHRTSQRQVERLRPHAAGITGSPTDHQSLDIEYSLVLVQPSRGSQHRTTRAPNRHQTGTTPAPLGSGPSARLAVVVLSPPPSARSAYQLGGWLRRRCRRCRRRRWFTYWTGRTGGSAALRRWEDNPRSAAPFSVGPRCMHGRVERTR